MTDNPASGPAKGLKGRIKDMAKERLPQGSRGRAVATAGLTSYRETIEFGRRLRNTWTGPQLHTPAPPSYRTWRQQQKASAGQLKAQREYSLKADQPASLHVIVLPGAGQLSDTVDSVRSQSWTHHTVTSCANAEAAGAAADASTSDFLIFLRAGDQLAPEAFYDIGKVARQDPLVDLVTWDDDMTDAKGHRGAPRFRPSWSPEMLLGTNYIGRSFAIRRSRFLAAGGLRPDAGGALEWDLLLRLDLTADRTSRVARVLSTVVSRDRVSDHDAETAVRAHLDRTGVPATAKATGGRVRLHWTTPDADLPHVTIAIPTKHNRGMLSRCLPSLARSAYPSFDVVIVDNGGHSVDNEKWYADNSHGLDLQVIWWTEEPFNYSRVNNAAAAKARGDVLLFLNDDTEASDPGWMREMVGWATRPEIGTVGLRLTDEAGKIQHQGVWLGVSGFADHVFQGMRPGEDSIFGSTDTYRDTLAVTGACVAVRRELFDEIGGFDERFQLTGSDVVLGLDAVLNGYRNVVSPYTPVRHLESATRGTFIPTADFFHSYWRYNTWLFGGDPYFSPSLSLGSRVPALRGQHEPTVRQLISGPLGRSFEAFRQTTDAAHSRMLAEACNAAPGEVDAVRQLHAGNAGHLDVKTVNWFFPDMDSPFYGGINTALRIADHMARNYGVVNRFVVVLGHPQPIFTQSALAAAFPALKDCEVVIANDDTEIPPADAAIATLWITAYNVMRAKNQKRKFYLVQDYEPGFYPAGTEYALAEESYKLGLYALCNTHNLKKVYTEEYGGEGMSFMPATDPSVFHARTRRPRTPDEPVTIFVYARPGHWRNCWELASPALELVKKRLGDRVRIVTAGAWATGGGADHDMKHLGLLPYKATGELYRNCDVGLALTVSRHPSYLPLELMSCGVPVVAFDNPWGHWILKDGENSLLSMRTVDGLADRLEKLCTDFELRQRLSKQALADIADRHSDWEKALAGIYPYLCDPDAGS